MGYSHTQYGRFHVLFYVPLVIMVGAMCFQGPEAVPLPLFAGVGLVLVVSAQAFRTLTIEDEGDALSIRYGPLPLIRKRIMYDSIQGVEVGTSSWIDGWGVHWFPGRGWTYNLWGFACVALVVRGRTIRIGTDDAENLAMFLRGKCSD